MFSGLYGDLPEAKNGSEKNQQPESTSAAAAPPGSWSGSTMLLPTAKRPTPATAMPPTSTLLRGGGKSRGESTVPSKSMEKDKTSAQTATETETAADAAIPTGNSTAGPASASFWGATIVEEYEPSRPNDYDAICRRKEQLRLEAVEEAERQERLRELKELEELERIREEKTNGTSMEIYAFGQQLGTGAGVGGGLGFVAAGGGGGTVAGEAAAIAAAGGPKGMTLAQRMLEKMGWKAGEGLGKSGQGIEAPLAVQKTDARSGRVVALEPLVPVADFNAAAIGQQREPSDLETAGTPSKVLVLRNLVPPGAVDESLDEEIGIECSKYGEVTSVLIFEVTEPDFVEEEAVRVYVQFGEQTAAEAALLELSGRLFGGRVVRARYFSEARFEKGDLAPKLGEDL